MSYSIQTIRNNLTVNEVLSLGLEVLMNRYIGIMQGCALRKITRSPKVSNHEIQGAQPNAYMKKLVYLVAQRQKLVACGTQAPLDHSPGMAWALL